MHLLQAGTEAAAIQGQADPGELTLELEVLRRVPLAGEELEEWQASRRAQLLEGTEPPPELAPLASVDLAAECDLPFSQAPFKENRL